MSWGNLPPDLVRGVIHKLQQDDGLPGAANVRLVCKSWLEAFTQYPGQGSCGGIDKLDEFCKLLPALTGLEAYAPRPVRVNLRPLQAYSQVTKLILHAGEAEKGGRAYLATDDLPDHIRFLSLNSMPLSEQGSQKQLTGLTSLALVFMQPKDESLCQLLLRVPNLKELTLLASSDTKMDIEGIGCDGLSQLTKLTLAMHEYKTPIPEKAALQNLQEFDSIQLTTTDAWLNSLFRAAPQLVSVSTGSALQSEGPWKPLNVPKSVRKLRLDRKGPLGLPKLELEEFFWKNTHPSEVLLEDDVIYIGTLTSLTSLEIQDVTEYEGVEPLQQLSKLRELTLRNCNSNLPKELLEVASFQALEKLHIEESSYNGLRDPPCSDSEGGKEETHEDEEDDFSRSHNIWLRQSLESEKAWMQDTGKAVLSLPKLTRVSGEATLINLGMLEGLKSWHVQEVENDVNWLCRGWKVWTKP